MQWSDTVKEYIQTLKPVENSPALRQRMWGLIDLTSLNETDNETNIAPLFEKVRSPYGHVAAVCVFPRLLRLTVSQLTGTSIKAATVANFPEGGNTLDAVLIEIGHALQDGAQEIDVVFPYARYLAGERQYAHTFVASCKAACGTDALLKVILETGALGDIAIIADASYDAFASGADFIKTSTGKIAHGASLEAVATMLLVAQHIGPQLKRHTGVKVSGGVRTIEQAAQYLALADMIMGEGWASPHTLRFGASQLADAILKEG